jgi:hypothetical protein
MLFRRAVFWGWSSIGECFMARFADCEYTVPFRIAKRFFWRRFYR